MTVLPPAEKPHLRILGTRGVPAQHGGFETFAEHLAPYMLEHGWRVTVYCQEDGSGPIREDDWQGVRRVIIPVKQTGAKGTVVFDWKAMRHAIKEQGVVLTLGYNTAIFSIPYRLKRIRHIMNMDGIEWKRAKWSPLERLWLYLNEWAGCYLANHLIADHPEIENHLATRVCRKKITMIPYGSDALYENPPPPYGDLPVEPGKYALVIARPEPENSILEIVTAFSMQPRGYKLVVLGNYDDKNPYHRSVKEAASDEVLFPGAIYEKAAVQSLRYHARLYIHGHQVGGTNPSLVEALGAANPIVAHDNVFNQWVAGEGATFFESVEGLSALLPSDMTNDETLYKMASWSARRHATSFTWDYILHQCSRLLRSSHG